MRLSIVLSLLLVLLGARGAAAGELTRPSSKPPGEAASAGQLAAPRALAPTLLDVTLRPPLLPLSGGLVEAELLDEGGGGRGFQGTFPAIFLALFVGLGSAHAIADDRDGALRWLALDAGVIAATITAGAITGLGLVWLGGLAVLVTERIFQARSAHAAAQGFDPIDDGNNRYDDESEQQRRDQGGDDRIDAAAPRVPASAGVTLLRAAF